MVQAIINIKDESNQILNIIKAKYGLKDKSEAINAMAEQYGQELLEPQLRPAFVAEVQKRYNEKPIKVGSVAKLRARYE